MRATVWRRLASGLLLVPLAGLAAVAQPVPPDWRPTTLPPLNPADADRLKAESETLAKERKAAESAAGSDRARLAAQLTALLKRIDSLPDPSLPPPRSHESPKTKFVDPDPGKAVDGLRLAMNLFRDGDFRAAYQAFRNLDPLTRDDRSFVRYMAACCLRRMGRTSEAEVIYREIANGQATGQEDEFIAGCAVSQLSILRTNQELEAQLAQLRSRPKGR
jgi:hypothetical protein